MKYFNLVKKLLRESAIYALGPTLQSAVTFILLPLYTSYLSTSEYGELEFVLAVALFLGPLIDSGFTSSFWKFGVGENISQREKVLSNILFSKLLISVSIAVIFIVLSFVIRSESLDLISWYTIVLVLQAILQTIYLEYQSTHRADLYVAIAFSVALATALANIVLITKLNMGIKGIILGNILGIVSALIIFFPTYFRFIKFSLDFSLIKGLLAYGFPLVFGNLAYLVTSTSDRFFLNFFSTSSDLGLYGYGNKFASLLNILIITPFFLGFNPIRWEIYASESAKETFAKLYSLIFSILLLCYFGFSAFGTFLGIRLTGNPEFILGLQATPLRAFSYLLYGLYYFRSMGLLFEKKTTLISVVTILAAVTNIIFNLLLVPNFSYIGSAVSSVIAYMVMFGVCSMLSQRYYPIKVDNNIEIGGIILVIINCIATLIITSKNINLIFIPSMVMMVITALFFVFLNFRKLLSLMKGVIPVNLEENE